jgi:nitrite reductase (NADH) large subunit
MRKQKLVVVGNGMAGARAIEEVLARGGADMFDITMFGAEPYGNYNRILLSNILCGIQDASEIYINTLDWYEENGITLHVGSPVVDIDRASKKVKTQSGIIAPYDVLLIATGSRAFIPPIAGLNRPDGTMKDGIYGFRTIDDCDGIIASARTSKRAAVIGGGLLGLEAARGLLNHGCEVHLVHLGGHLMEAQLDKPPCCARRWKKWVSPSISNATPPRSWARAVSPDCISNPAKRWHATCSWLPPAYAPTPRSAAPRV